MAAVLKGYFPQQSLPVGLEKRMAGLHPNASVSRSSQGGELSELSCVVSEEEDNGEEEREIDAGYEMVQREEAADMPPELMLQGYRGYGAVAHGDRQRKRRKRRRHRRHSPPRSPQYSLSPHHYHEHHRHTNLHSKHRRFYSTTALSQEYGTEYEHLLSRRQAELSGEEEEEDRRSQSSSEEEAPLVELIYRRTCKDKTKLILIPLLYFLFFVVAGVFAFFSIDALVTSYNNLVRTVKYVTVEEYHPVGIAFFLEDFATYESCEFKYGDDLAPHPGNWTPLIPDDITDQCNTSLKVTFFSTLVQQNRTALVFRGPTRVRRKQSLLLNFSVDTTKREFGAIEYMLFNTWDILMEMSDKERGTFLAKVEASKPLYTVPAGFRSWIKIYYVIRNDGSSNNSSEFYLNTDFSKFSDSRPLENRTTDPVVALFEWKSDTYEYISDILSTTVWNTLGSLAGVFVTLIKAGEYFTAWVRRIRRERRKKKQKLKELEEERERQRAEFERRKEERKRLKQSQAQGEEKVGLDE